MNSLQVITSLSYFRVPVGIALAVGVGLRFLPVFGEEARRVRIRQRRQRIMSLPGKKKPF
jgi:energy-coupling factor transporter transmembrane protein EcfT